MRNTTGKTDIELTRAKWPQSADAYKRLFDGASKGVPVKAVGLEVERNDADGGSVTFQVGKPYAYGKPGSFGFLGPNGEEVFGVDSEGMFRVRGEVVAEDRMAYEGFRLWLGMAMSGIATPGAVTEAKKEAAVLKVERIRLLKDIALGVEHRAEMATEVAALRRQLAGGAVFHLRAEDGYSACGRQERSPDNDDGLTPLISNVTCRECLVDRAKDADRLERMRPKKIVRKMSMQDRRRMRALEEAVIWMSGSPSFAPEGEAHQGFVSLVRPLLESMDPEDVDDPEAAGKYLAQRHAREVVRKHHTRKKNPKRR